MFSAGPWRNTTRSKMSSQALSTNKMRKSMAWDATEKVFWQSESSHLESSAPELGHQKLHFMGRGLVGLTDGGILFRKGHFLMRGFVHEEVQHKSCFSLIGGILIRLLLEHKGKLMEEVATGTQIPRIHGRSGNEVNHFWHYNWSRWKRCNWLVHAGGCWGNGKVSGYLLQASSEMGYTGG